jgi:hypothetical protein
MSVFSFDGVESYKGATLAEYEINGYDDSDWIAIVWDESTQSVQSIEYRSTRGACGAANFSIDGTPEAYTKAFEYGIKLEIAAEISKATEYAALVGKGKRVTFKGNRRKGISNGNMGEVFWAEAVQRVGDYNGRKDLKIGVVLGCGSRVFATVTDTVKVSHPSSYIPTAEKIEDVVRAAYANIVPDQGTIYSMFHYSRGLVNKSRFANTHDYYARGDRFNTVIGADAPEGMGEVIVPAPTPVEKSLTVKETRLSGSYLAELFDGETLVATGEAKSIRGAVYDAFKSIKKFGVRYIYPEAYRATA